MRLRDRFKQGYFSRWIPLVLLLASLTLNSHGVQQETAGGPFRYNEDWRFIGETGNLPSHWWVPLKHQRIGKGYVSFGAETRLRYESLRELDWGSSDQRDANGYLWLRALPHVDWHYNDYLRAFAQLAFAGVIDRDPEPSAIDQNTTDFQQLFIEIGHPENSEFGFIAGRRVTSLGSSRLLGTRYGANVVLSLDQIEISYNERHFEARIFYGRPVVNDRGTFDDNSSQDLQLWSLYTTWYPQNGVFHSAFDLYYIGLRDNNAQFIGQQGEEIRHTYGLRVFGEIAALDWNHELFIQHGSFGDLDIQAWSLATEFGYTFGPPAAPSRFSLKFDLISGDSNRTDRELGTFNPLFPSLKYFGEAGVVAPYNLIDLHPTLEVGISPNWRAIFQIDFLWRYSLADDLYGPGGGLIRRGDLSSARYIATQYEFVVERELVDNWSLSASYAFMPAGEFVADTGPDKDFHFVGFELMYLF